MITQNDFLVGVTSRVGWNDQIIIVQTGILFRVKEVVIMWDNKNKSKLSRENWDYGHSSCRRKQFYRYVPLLWNEKPFSPQGFLFVAGI